MQNPQHKDSSMTTSTPSYGAGFKNKRGTVDPAQFTAWYGKTNRVR